MKTFYWTIGSPFLYYSIKGRLCVYHRRIKIFGVYRGIVLYHFQYGLWWGRTTSPPPLIMDRENRPWTKGLRIHFVLEPKGPKSSKGVWDAEVLLVKVILCKATTWTRTWTRKTLMTMNSMGSRKKNLLLIARPLGLIPSPPSLMAIGTFFYLIIFLFYYLFYNGPAFTPFPLLMACPLVKEFFAAFLW